MRRRPAYGLVALTVAAAAGCRSPVPTAGNVCSVTDCKLQGTARWSLALDPPASSALSPRQYTNQLVGADGFWQVDSTTQVVVTLSLPAGSAPISPQAELLLSLPASIPGLPNLSFESAVGALPDGRLFATLNVPSLDLGVPGLLTLQPVPPGDQTLPTYQWAVAPSAAIALALPGDDVLFHGQLLGAGNQTLATTFVARAYQNGLLVSDAPIVQANGQFEVRIPSVVAANPVTLSLAPVTPPNADPWFVSTPFTASPGENLGTINLPAYAVPPAFFNVATSDVSTDASISGIKIVALTSLGNAVVSGGAGGSATFQNAAVTGDQGIATLSLLPGTASRQAYNILATPPVGSPYAIHCVTAEAGTGATRASQATTLSKILLTPRPVLLGTVHMPDGSPVPNVAVTATGTPDPPAPTVGCSAPTAVSAGTTTDARGAFTLRLDPGTYRIDYDPPPGALVPRKTLAVTVTADLTQDVPMSAGAWLTGTVVGPDPDRLPVPSTAVRFFEICSDPTSCPGGLAVAPPLVAATFTDAQGRFQVAVPVSP